MQAMAEEIRSRVEAEGGAPKEEKKQGPNLPRPPLTPDETRLRGVLTEAPEEPEFLIRLDGEGLLTRGIVGMVAGQGGAGKTMFCLQLGMAAAAAGTFGPFEAPEPLRVLILAAEDPTQELDRRLWAMAGGDFPEHFYAASVLGKIGPLMELKANNPRRSPWWAWLDETLSAHGALDVLILDPKSRLFGLEENSNDHATQFVASLEALAQRHRLTILFTHHAPKGAKTINQALSRGAQALVDACRFGLGVMELDEERGKKLGIEDFQTYLEVKITKNNYGACGSRPIHFRRGAGGLLSPVNLSEERIKPMALHLSFLLGQDGYHYTKRELIGRAAGKDIRAQMGAAFKGFVASRDMGPAIDHLLEEGFLSEQLKPGARGQAFVLTPAEGRI